MAGPMGGPHGRRSNEKPKDFKKTLKRLIINFSPYKIPILIDIIMVLVAVILTILSPIFIGDTINNILRNPANFYSKVDGLIVVNWAPLLIQFGLVLAVYVSSALFNWLSEWLLIPITSTYSYDMRKKFQSKVDKLPLSYFDKQTYGEILSKGTNDIDTVARSIQQIALNLLSSIFLFFGSIIAMFVLSWQLALVALASLPLSIAITLIVTKSSQKYFKVYHKKLGNLNSVIEETYSGFKIVKLFNQEKQTNEKFQKINNSMTHDDRFSQFFSGIIFPSINFVNNLVFVGICVVGGMAKDIGNMVTFFVLVSVFQQPFQRLGQIMNVIQSSVAAAERVYAVFDEGELVPNRPEAIIQNDFVTGHVQFENVDFSYSPDRPLIQNMNLDIKPGESVAIVGPTGAGKTTIVNLIMRFYEVNQGSIKIDNIDIRDYTYEALRKSLGMVLQDTWLFNGTIKENIRYSNEHATDEEIIEAAHAAHAHFFIQTLPDGYDFILTEDGTNVSQGQRQLITIARAILNKPKILILDEATSSVDTRTEAAIQEAMDKMMQGRTSFVVAHRLSTIKNAKLILVMQKGKIVEQGNHQELLTLNGFYADLYNAQFSGSNPLSPLDVEN